MKLAITTLIAATLMASSASATLGDHKNGIGNVIDQQCSELNAQGWDNMDSQAYYVVFCMPRGWN